MIKFATRPSPRSTSKWPTQAVLLTMMYLQYNEAVMVNLLGADYMANFSPVNRVEISARLPDYMRKVSDRAEIQKTHVIVFKFQPGQNSEFGHAY